MLIKFQILGSSFFFVNFRMCCLKSEIFALLFLLGIYSSMIEQNNVTDMKLLPIDCIER